MAGSQEARRRSLADVSVTIGPVAEVPTLDLSGYGEGGTITLEPNSDYHTYTVGQDGAVAVSENLDKVVVATITVLETTRAYRRLARLAQAQKRQGILECPFFYDDPNNGDQISEPNAFFTSPFSLGAEQEAQDRETTIVLPSARDQMEFGAAIA